MRAPVGRPPTPRNQATRNLPPVTMPGLTPEQHSTLLVASTLKRQDAIACMGIKPATYDARLKTIRDKFQDQENLRATEPVLSSGFSSVGGLLTAGFVRTGKRR